MFWPAWPNNTITSIWSVSHFSSFIHLDTRSPQTWVFRSMYFHIHRPTCCWNLSSTFIECEQWPFVRFFGALWQFLVGVAGFGWLLVVFFPIWIFYNLRLTDQMSSNSHISTFSIEMIFMWHRPWSNDLNKESMIQPFWIDQSSVPVPGMLDISSASLSAGFGTIQD